MDLVYPIGRGFIDFTDGDYSSYLGFTWERELVGMFPLGADDTNYKIGQTGGSSTKTITKANLPNYNLTVTDPGHSHRTSQRGSGTGTITGDATADPIVGEGNTATSTNKTGISVNSGGSGQAINIMPPFKAVYYWKRVA